MSDAHPWIVHKFGGSSIADGAGMDAVARLLDAREEPRQVVVVSAMRGVTDALIHLARDAAAGVAGWREDLARLHTRHGDAAAAAPVDFLGEQFDRLEHLLEGLELLGNAPAEAVDLIAGLGEMWSARLLAARLNRDDRPAAVLDARDILMVDASGPNRIVDWHESARRLAAAQDAHSNGKRFVIPGFVCRDLGGRVTTLGRNGSDYSASLFAGLFGAAELHIWTDVDGILSADPTLVPQARVLEALSYREAFELAYFGARVIHPQTLAPATERGIPIHIRNTAHPDRPGTRIDPDGDPATPVKGVTRITGMALVNLEGTGLIGVPGTAERVFGALHAAGVSVTMISQGSSEHSICCVLPEADAERAEHVLGEAFHRELAAGQIQRITVTPDIQVLALVGDGMAGVPGISGRLFSALGRAGVNVRAIAQGASERNISVAVEAAQATRALRAVHAGFYLSDQTISIGLIGPGQVGRALLAQLRDTREGLRERSQLDLRVRAVAGSKRMVLGDPEIPESTWKGLDESAEECDLDTLADHIQAEHLPHAVIIDCSASDEVAERYAGWLSRGIHVITPNKHAGSGPAARYRRLRDLHRSGSARWRYEATVGAGLPVVQTLRDLLDTGDTIRSIEGIFSGTLAWLFNRYDGQIPFSDLVRTARGAGYTEPDPRDDLSGTDVARKLVILAREMGLDLELDDVEVESLVPDGLDGGDADAFLDGLAVLDETMRQRFERARRDDRVLRCIAALEAEGQAKVTLEAVAADHPFAHIAATDNVVAFTTARYRDNPLIVQGPGAGPEVTAAGVFADLLRIAGNLGAKL